MDDVDAGHFPKRILMIGGALLAVAIGIFVSTQVRGTEHVSGTLYLTLQTPDPSGASGATKLNIYTYDLSTQKLAPYFVNDRRNITPAFSPDGSKMVFASRFSKEAAYQLFVSNVETGAVRELTRDANRFKREPVWSPDGRYVAYALAPQKTTSPWLVMITDLAGISKVAGAGAIDPFFSPDGTTLFELRSGGLYSVSVAQIESSKPKAGSTITAVLALPPIAGATSTLSEKISVSPDGTRLAWSVPLANLLRIYRVVRWSPLTLSVEKEIQTHASFSVFSPDSRSLAFIAVDPGASSVSARPRVMVYRLGDDQARQVLDLSQYATTYLWLSAWRS